MNKTQELTLKIEDLEERIAPHISVYLPEVSNVADDKISVHTHGGVHASIGPEADPMVKPHK